jgi:hypothetical protein
MRSASVFVVLAVGALGVAACGAFGSSDSGGGGTSATPVVACGSVSCSGGAYCCVHGRNQEPIECVTGQGACPDQYGARAYCDDPSDCPSGNVCCLQYGGIFGLLAACTTATACPADAEHDRLCDPGIAGQCGTGSCVAFTTARPTYGWRLQASVCQP